MASGLQSPEAIATGESYSSLRDNRQVLAAKLGLIAWGLFLVSVPVLFQAPLVRYCPEVSLGMTVGLWGMAKLLQKHRRWADWGDILGGFTWSWLAGSIYWGWLGDQPYWHIPIEALGLPSALIALGRGRGFLGYCFYLGSLLGTVLTDLYFCCVGVFSYWRPVFQSDDARAALALLRDALACVGRPQGLLISGVFVGILLGITGGAIATDRRGLWLFGGAVLGTLIVDALFGLVALLP